MERGDARKRIKEQELLLAELLIPSAPHRGVFGARRNDVTVRRSTTGLQRWEIQCANCWGRAWQPTWELAMSTANDHARSCS